MDVHPAPQPHQAPPNGRTPFHFFLFDHLLRRLHAVRSACRALHAWMQATTRVSRWVPAGFRHPLTGYLFALLLDMGVASLTLLLVTRLPDSDLPSVLLLVGIVLVALTCGVGPSLLATGVGVLLLAGIAWLASHTSRLGAEDWLDLVVFLVSGLGLSLLAGLLSAAKASSDQERQRLRALLEVLPVPVTMVDAQGRFLENTPAGKAIWGDSASWARSLAETPAYPAWRPDTGQPVAREELPLVRALTRGQSTLNEELEVEAIDGQRHTLLNSASPMRDASGSMVGAVSVILDITERKRLEEALRQAEREAAARAGELEAIFEALTDGLLVYDAQGHIVHYNQAASQLFGFEASPEFVALSLQERAVRYALRDAEGQLIPPEQFAPARVLRGEVFTSAQATDQRLETPDGRKVAVSMTGRPLRNADGTIIGAVSIARDVTERRRLEEQVAERAAQLEAILESIADGVVVTDREGRVLHMNQAGRTLLGLDLDPTGWTLLQLDRLAGFAGYTPAGQRLTEVDDPFPRVLQGAVLTNEQSLDAIIRTRAGRETWINTTGAPIRDAGDQVLGSVFVSRDVTEQRRLEQQTRETLDALLAMAEALVQAPEAGSAALAVGAPETNHVACRLAELTRRVLDYRYVGMAAVEPGTGKITPITLVGVSPEQAQQWWASWGEHARLGQHLSPGQVAALHAGEPILVTSVHTPFPKGRDLVPGSPSVLVPMRMGDTLVGILRVEGGTPEEASRCLNRKALISAVARLGALVLERERLLSEREEARANEMAVRQTQAEMETFLGMAGHELKTPLTSLKLALQLIERRLHRLAQGEPDRASPLAPLLDQVTRAGRQTTRLERLVNELLDATRVRAGKLELHPEPTDLAAIVGEAIEEQRQAHPARALTFQFAPARTVPVVADADRIGQVVTNYLTNALKYSPPDRPVAVGLDVQPQQARVWVRDEGPGLPLQEQDRIWERFHRVKGIAVQSGSGVGLGLGLHICRTIIERHQGQVGVESAPGQGSTFWFTVPLGGEPEEGGPAPG